jgi:hypothetical protein
MHLMRCRHLHAINTDPHGRDRVLGLLARFLLGECRHQFWWYCATQGIKRHYLLFLIGATIQDDALESPHLQLHLNQKRPIRVIGLGAGMVATPTAYLTNHPLDNDTIFGGVVVDLLPFHLHNRDRNLALHATCESPTVKNTKLTQTHWNQSRLVQQNMTGCSAVTTTDVLYF